MENIYMKILKNIIITAAMLAVATAICFILRPLVPTDTHVPLIYVLAVLCVSRLTEGYFYGVLASMVAVVGVNYIFTYPYFQVDFTVTGYPLTFIVMLTAWNLDPDVTTDFSNVLAGYARAFLKSPVIVRVLLCITG